MITKIMRIITLLLAVLLCAGCQSEKKDESTTQEQSATAGDLVVYDKIYTAKGEGEDAIAEAFVVKDGKYIYVGDAEGAKDYIDDQTEVIDHKGKGMTMPGCTEGHGHYLQFVQLYANDILFLTRDETHDTILQKVKERVDQAKKEGKSSDYIFGFGWVFSRLKDQLPSREELDAIADDIPIFLADDEAHKAIVNSYCLKEAGVIDDEGHITKKIRGGEIGESDGLANGFATEQAATYIRLKSVKFSMTKEKMKSCIQQTEDLIHALGYTSVFEGWANYWNTEAYEVFHEMDENGELNANFALCYAIMSCSEDVKGEIDKASEFLKYDGKNLKPNYLKVFADGTVDAFTAYMKKEYKGKPGNYGNQNWEQEEMDQLVSYANDKGITVHTHAMGDAAVEETVDAYAKSKSDCRNQIVHLQYVPEESYKVMAENNVVVSSGALWHSMTQKGRDYYNTILEEPYNTKSYPMKSYLDNNVVMSLSTDAPANGEGPADPFGIMEVAVTGMQKHNGRDIPWDTEECLTREQVLKAFTYNGAYQMNMEEERGSIEVGKYADFILISRDVLTCDEFDIHDTEVDQTYFEGKKVYDKLD